jgi:hypothetical protein
VVVSGGARVSADYTALGFFGRASGELTLDGANWSDLGGQSAPFAGDMIVGGGEENGAGQLVGGGSGELLVEDGATLSDAAAYIALGNAATGSAQVLGGGTWSVAGDLAIGGSAHAAGSLQVMAGGSQGLSGVLDVGGTLAADGMVQFTAGGAGRVGALDIRGGNFTIDPTSSLHVGAGVATTFTGGLFIDGGGADFSNNAAGQVDGLTVIDGTLQVAPTATLTVGSVAGAAGATGIVIDPGITVNATGAVLGNLDLLGSVAVLGNNTIEGTLLGSGSLLLRGTVDILANLATVPATGVDFGDFTSSELVLAGSGEIGPLHGFVPQGRLERVVANTLDLPRLTYDPDRPIGYDGTTGILTVGGGAFPAETFTLEPGYDPAQLFMRPDGGTGTEIIGHGPCYALGTRIATPGGEAPVEALQPGDLVLALADGAWAPHRVRWVGGFAVDLARHPRPTQAAPIRIAAQAVAPGMPRRDLLVSPDHAIYLDDALFQAHALANGATIAQEFPARVTYLHVELDRHAVLLAEGLPAESYLDTGNRALFAGEAGARPLHPDLAALAVWAEHGCAPLHLQGPALAAVRARLLRRAEALGHRLTEDPDLRVFADGRETLVLQAGRRAWQAMLPAGARAVALRSRVFVPDWFTPQAADARRLGLAVTALRLGRRDVAAAAYGAGWHAPEPGWHWTSDEAQLALRPSRRPRVLSLAAASASARYWVPPPLPGLARALVA